MLGGSADPADDEAEEGGDDDDVDWLPDRYHPHVS